MSSEPDRTTRREARACVQSSLWASGGELVELCKAALEQESDWRETGPEGRAAAFERFQQLLHTIADLTGRTYEDVLNDAVEEWVTVHFCSIENDIVPSAEWAAAGKADPSQQSS